MRQLSFLSLRYWSRRRGRGATTILGVSLGVALMVSVGLINETIITSYQTVVEALAGKTHLEVRALMPQGLEEGWLDPITSFAT